MPKSNSSFTVIVPCFNEEEAIGETISHLRDHLEETSRYELFVIDDGSTDRSPEILREIQRADPTIRIVTHDRNRGYGAALKTGINRATTEFIAITDADGTYPNERIPELVEECEGFDMVVGARVGEDVIYSRIRAVPKVFLTAWASWIARQRIPDINSGMRVFRKDAAQRFIRFLPDTFSFTTTITLAMLTNYRPVKYVPISYGRRTGKSKIRPVKDTLRFSLLILRTGMYFAPVRVLLPIIVLLGLGTFGSLTYDFVTGNLTDKTVILAMFTINTSMLALLADMIDKRSRG